MKVTETEVNMTDGIDNDRDGKIDLADMDTVEMVSPPSRLRCLDLSSGTYTLCGGASDNQPCDSDIASPPVGFIQDGVIQGGICLPLEAEDTATKCGDSRDNDGDGQVDAADNDCFIGEFVTLSVWRNAQGGFLRPVQFGRYENECSDGKDNDGDGFYDCLDSDCFYGESCGSSITNFYNACRDYNGNGVIEGDWGDVAMAPLGTAKYAATVCAQLYNVDGLKDVGGRVFLQWMRTNHYAGRIINLHASQMREPYKRNSAEHRSYQFYFNLRNNLPYSPSNSNVPATTISFKNSGPFPIVLHVVDATDPWIENRPIPAGGMESLAQSILRIFFRNTQFTYRNHEISYETTIGFSSCPMNPFTCLDHSGVRQFMDAQRDPSTMNFFYFAGQSTDESRPFAIRTHLAGATISEAFQVPPGEFLTMYNHEMGHHFPLPHPLASVPQGDLNDNLRNILGTSSIMSTLGYIYTSVELIGPLEAYAMEPADGFDNPNFGQIYNQALLGSP